MKRVTRLMAVILAMAALAACDETKTAPACGGIGQPKCGGGNGSGSSPVNPYYNPLPAPTVPKPTGGSPYYGSPVPVPPPYRPVPQPPPLPRPQPSYGGPAPIVPPAPVIPTPPVILPAPPTQPLPLVLGEAVPAGDALIDFRRINYELTDNCFLLVQGSDVELRYYPFRCPLPGDPRLNDQVATFRTDGDTKIYLNGQVAGIFERYRAGSIRLFNLCNREFRTVCTLVQVGLRNVGFGPGRPADSRVN